MNPDLQRLYLLFNTWKDTPEMGELISRIILKYKELSRQEQILVGRMLIKKNSFPQMCNGMTEIDAERIIDDIIWDI